MLLTIRHEELECYGFQPSPVAQAKMWKGMDAALNEVSWGEY